MTTTTRNSIITADGVSIPLFGTSSLSIGQGVECAGRYSYDASRVPQGVQRRTRNAAQTASLAVQISPLVCADAGVRVSDYIAQVEGVVGQKIRLFLGDSEVGSFVVKSAQFSATPDPHDVISGMSIGLSLIEGTVHNPQPARELAPVAVRTLSGA